MTGPARPRAPPSPTARARRDWKIVALVAAVVYAVLGGFSVAEGGFAIGSYLLGTVLLSILVFSIYALGLSLEYGFTGLVNFGHIMFGLAGAYTAALVSIETGSLLLGVAAGLGLAALLAVLVGLPSVRLREDYLAIVTIGAAEILRRVAENEEWLTNGTLGLSGFPRPFLQEALQSSMLRQIATAFGMFPYQFVLLAFALAGVAVTYVIFERLIRSPWGRVLKAIREDEDVARALGKNVLSYKLQALALGSAAAAYAGILFIWERGTVYPTHFPHLTTFFIWIILVLGGVANHRGALVGAFLVWGVFETAPRVGILRTLGLTDLTGPPQAIFIGLVLILVMLFRPQGLIGNREELAAGQR